jgi:outer membrane protein
LLLFSQNSQRCAAIVLVVIAIVFSSTAFAVQDAVTAEANKLIAKRDFKAAYDLLEPLEAERAGDINYDYLFGVAAVESGNPTRGAFALERVLAQDPANKDARAEMAKAHFMLGETESSKAEFNNVLAQNPDAETRKTVEKLLTAIQKIDGTTTTFGAYLEFGLGYDSNVSSAPGITTVSVPVFGGALLDLGSSSKEKSDNFMSMAGGVSFRHPLTPQLATFGSVGGNRKINGSEIEFDTSNLDFNAGLQYRLNQNNFTVALQDNHFDLNDESFRHAYGGSAQWLHNIDASNQAGLYAQYSRLKFIGNEFRNAERSIVGINAAHVFKGSLSPVIYGSIYGGREDARNSQADFLDQDIVGMRLGGQLSLDRRWQLLGSLATELRDNDEQDPAFLTKRKDRQYDASLGINFIPARDWSIKPQITYTKNDSNIVINDFDRTIFSVTARKDFSW